MDFVVREARAGDADALLRVQREASLSAFAHIFPAASAGEFPDEVIRRSWVAAVASPSAQVLVAERHGEVVGVVSLYPGDGLLARLFVVPRHWGEGIGGHLHDLAVERLRSEANAAPWLWVLEDNHEARGFYERRGWRFTGETRLTSFPPHPGSLKYALEPGA
jgi:GNAT superfamily N-acetyltransferase